LSVEIEQRRMMRECNIVKELTVKELTDLGLTGALNAIWVSMTRRYVALAALVSSAFSASSGCG
jgi:hypothetical protein